jgi:hypothetical protein
MNEKRLQLIESCLTLNENVVVHIAQTNAISQKINISLVIKNLRKRLKEASTKSEVDKVKQLAQKNIDGFKKYWNRNTKSLAKPITKIKEDTFNKAISQMQEIIKQCDEKKKTLKK